MGFPAGPLELARRDDRGDGQLRGGFRAGAAGDHGRLISVMEGVEDIPGAVLAEGLAWDWESFPRVSRCPRAATPRHRLRGPTASRGAAHIRHGRTRRAAGDRHRRRHRPDARAGRRRDRAGALGFSTSRTLNHRPVRRSDALAQGGGGGTRRLSSRALSTRAAASFELISDFDSPGTCRRIRYGAPPRRRSGVPTSVSLAQVHHDPTAWRELARLDRERGRGGLVARGQVAPRPVGTLLGCRPASIRSAPTPPFARSRGRRSLSRCGPFATRNCVAGCWRKIPLGGPARPPPVSAISNVCFLWAIPRPMSRPPIAFGGRHRAAREGRPALEVALDLLLETGWPGLPVRSVLQLRRW